MTQAAAVKQSRTEITMYRRGNGWVVCAYDPRARCNRRSGEMQYRAAQDKVRRERASRIDELLCIAHDHANPYTYGGLSMANSLPASQIATPDPLGVASVAPASGHDQEAGCHAQGSTMHITNTDKFWVVTKATPVSTLVDVLCETDLSGLALQIRGGLSPASILLLTDNRESARDRAVSELQTKGATHAR